jgi:cytochrome c553
MKRRTSLVVFCTVLLMPLVALAYPNARQELLAVLRAKPNPDHGAELFRNCAICHGAAGGGTTDGGVARIAGQHFSVIAKQLVDYRHDRRWDIRMEHFSDRHLLADAQAIADVAEYITRLAIRVPPGVGDGELVDHGAEVYARRCQSCHGRSADGNEKSMIPRIAGQHYEYLMRQIYDAVDGRRPNFSTAHVRLLARLERNDIVGLADYLSRLCCQAAVPASPLRSRTIRTN